MVVLGVLPPQNGIFSHAFAVPNDPGLAGLALRAQAIVLETEPGLRAEANSAIALTVWSCGGAEVPGSGLRVVWKLQLEPRIRVTSVGRRQSPMRALPALLIVSPAGLAEASSTSIWL